MTRVVVLFNLKESVDASAYEQWATQTEMPLVRGLESVTHYSVHGVTGLLGDEGAAPYQYVELIDIDDMQQFGKDVSVPSMQSIIAAFGEFADSPVFLTTRELERAS